MRDWIVVVRVTVPKLLVERHNGGFTSRGHGPTDEARGFARKTEELKDVHTGLS